MHAVRLRRTIAHDIEAQLAAGIFHPMVHIPLGRTQYLRHLGHDFSIRQIIDCLADDLCALNDFMEAHLIAVPIIPVRSQGHIEIKAVVYAVAVDLADIIIHPAGPDIRSGHAVPEHILPGQRRCPLQTMIKNLIATTKDGSIIILHDSNEKNLNVAKAGIDALKSEGYEFVTVSELFRLRGVTPQNGRVYYSVPATRETDYDESELSSHWAASYIDYVRENGIMVGENTGFVPNGYMTRAMAVQILYRMAGCPAAKAESATEFSDVAEGSWYTEAVAWAHKTGVVNGVSDTSFAPEEMITKEQFYAIADRYAKKALKKAPDTEDKKTFSDDSKIDDWAAGSVSELRSKGFVSDNDREIFRPRDYMTRAEAAELVTWIAKKN